VGLVALAGAAWAWQAGLAQLGLDASDVERGVTSRVYEATGRTVGQMQAPSLGKSAAAARAMSGAARAALVRELGQAAKKIVMSPGFAAAHDKYIANAHNAVNHGIAVRNDQKAMEKAVSSGDEAAVGAAMQNVMRDAFRNMVADRLKQKAIDGFDATLIGIMVETDLGMLEMAASTAAEKAAAAKAKTMYAEAKKLAGTDLAKARETFRAASLLAAGLKDEAAGASMQADAAKQEQQRNYNEHSLKVVMKARLNEFVALGKTVDFAAQTQLKDGRQVFVRPAYERQTGMWKFLYRLGAEGTKEAMAQAQAWAGEL
jgi:hypothetical protein